MTSEVIRIKGAMCCLQAKPYKYRCSSCQAAVTYKLANRLFHLLGKDYFMFHKILCGFITVHSPFNVDQHIHVMEIEKIELRANHIVLTMSIITKSYLCTFVDDVIIF